jgi:hypothetical protein
MTALPNTVLEPTPKGNENKAHPRERWLIFLSFRGRFGFAVGEKSGQISLFDPRPTGSDKRANKAS